jgi:hypothetical protein
MPEIETLQFLGSPFCGKDGLGSKMANHKESRLTRWQSAIPCQKILYVVLVPVKFIGMLLSVLACIPWLPIFIILGPVSCIVGKCKNDETLDPFFSAAVLPFVGTVKLFRATIYKS